MVQIPQPAPLPAPGPGRPTSPANRAEPSGRSPGTAAAPVAATPATPTPGAATASAAASTPAGPAAAPAAPPLSTTPRLSPGTLATLTGTDPKAEKEAREKFMEAVKTFLADTMGMRERDIEKMRLSDDAMRYIMRNTVLGALAPPGMMQELGLGIGGAFNKGVGYGTDVASIQLDMAPLGGPRSVIRIGFDAARIEEIGRAPLRRRDADGDGMFTTLDLLPGTRSLRVGEAAPGDPQGRFKSTLAGTEAGSRTAITDSKGRTFFAIGATAPLPNAPQATARLAFGLLQFARPFA